jgi:hypothetical protein
MRAASVLSAAETFVGGLFLGLHARTVVSAHELSNMLLSSELTPDALLRESAASRFRCGKYACDCSPREASENAFLCVQASAAETSAFTSRALEASGTITTPSEPVTTSDVYRGLPEDFTAGVWSYRGVAALPLFTACAPAESYGAAWLRRGRAALRLYSKTAANPRSSSTVTVTTPMMTAVGGEEESLPLPAAL